MLDKLRELLSKKDDLEIKLEEISDKIEYMLSPILDEVVILKGWTYKNGSKYLYCDNIRISKDNIIIDAGLYYPDDSRHYTFTIPIHLFEGDDLIANIRQWVEETVKMDKMKKRERRRVELQQELNDLNRELN